jgi:hypothetical protein
MFPLVAYLIRHTGTDLEWDHLAGHCHAPKQGANEHVLKKLWNIAY